MSTFARENAAFDAQDLFARFTLDSASEFLFGNCLNTLSGSLPIAGRAKMGPKGSSIDDEFGTFAWAFEVGLRPSRCPEYGMFTEFASGHTGSDRSQNEDRETMATIRVIQRQDIEEHKNCTAMASTYHTICIETETHPAT